MISSSPNSPFARKGKATPTPVPEDSVGFVSGLSNDVNGFALPNDKGSSTVVSFDPTAPVGDSVPDSPPEAASMLGIRLSPRENLSRSPDHLDIDGEGSPASANVAILPLPENKSMMVIDDPKSMEEHGQAGKWRKIVAAFSVLIVVLVGATIYATDESRVPRSMISKPVATLHPTPIAPKALVTPDERMIPRDTPPAVIVPEKRITSKAKPAGLYSIQLGSLRSSRDAERELRTLKQRHGDKFSGLDLRVVAGSVSGKGRVWRIRVIGLPSADSARRVCRRLEAQNNSCLILRRP